MNRRELMAGAGALALAACAPKADAPAAVAAADPFAGANLMADVEAYVGFGTHRTGSAGDLATSDWFAARWKELGYKVEQFDVTCPNADTHVARLRIGDEAFDGFAQPPLVFTPEGGLTAPISWWDPNAPTMAAGKIVLVHVPRERGDAAPMGAYRELIQKCAAAGAKAVVAVMSGPSGEVVAINTPLSLKPGIPVLQIGERHKRRIETIISMGGPARLIMEGPGSERTGKCTVARLGEAGPWVIVSTPQSGWFTCGGERGPGIAMSRALSAWAATSGLPVRWLFIATSGHEWIDAGAEIFHKTLAPEPADTALWFHLGASYGARAYEETDTGLVAQATPNLFRTLMTTPDMVPVCEAAFAGQPPIDTPMTADLARALGEYRLVLEEGYPSSAGFWGYNALFHTPIDGADSTTPEILETVGRAVKAAVEGRLAKI